MNYSKLDNMGQQLLKHDEIMQLLPWFVKGTLKPSEHDQVQQHLSACTTCQQELSLYQQLATLNSIHKPDNVWQPSPAHFSDIMSHIDELEKLTVVEPAQVKPSHFTDKINTWIKANPNPIFWFMSFETIGIAALVLLMVGRTPLQSNELSFATLSNDKPIISKQLPRLQIVFSDAITEREIRTLLQTQQAQIVQGPSLLGVYVIELSEYPTNTLQKIIDELRKNPNIKLVESSTN